ncbi:MAG TPA: caspase family protein, partial [Allosphingosinicella sp.]|nr:caspase family protein [Allosphingosinicella sp.]
PSGGRSSSTQQAPRANAPQPPRIEALVLSQSYQGTRLALANTGRDAALIAASFQRLRFEKVMTHHDGGVDQTLARIAEYLRTVDGDTIALVYVAGHGVEIAGENLLVLEGGTSFLSLQALVQALQERAGVTILFLDACRNNPFDGAAPASGRVSRALAGENGVRLQTQSLDELRAASSGAPGRLRAFALQGSGIKIVFSTDPANVALDGIRGSRNGPFAQALARRIRESASLDDIVALTTGDVIRATRRAQSPWSQGSIDRPIFLSGRRRRAQTSFR